MDTEYNLEDEILDDDQYELCEEAPDFDAPQTGPDGEQDDDTDVPVGLGFLARATGAVRTYPEMLSWYASHKTREQIGFDPDNMCLKICRTSRNIPAKYLTAKEAQDNTPNEFRVRSVADLRKGMFLFFDDPHDSNAAGHIVGLIGRRRGINPNELGSLLTMTNSVKMDELVTVAGDYYATHWGDQFQFGATWLNGVEIDVAGGKTKLERFNNGGPVYNLNFLWKAKSAGREHAGRVLDRINTQVKRLPDSPKLPRVREFKQEWQDTRKIDMDLLDASVTAGRTGIVRQVRDEINRLIETLPDE